jgi:pyruvate-ferredoxin/flavodoxin oxidoreductase
MLAGRGDHPVSMLPVDGTTPPPPAASRSGTSPARSRFGIGYLHPVRQLRLRLPHGALRAKFYHQDWLASAPRRQSVPVTAKGFPDSRYTLQLYRRIAPAAVSACEACPVRAGADETVKASGPSP